MEEAVPLTHLMSGRLKDFCVVIDPYMYFCIGLLTFCVCVQNHASMHILGSELHQLLEAADHLGRHLQHVLEYLCLCVARTTYPHEITASFAITFRLGCCSAMLKPPHKPRNKQCVCVCVSVWVWV